MKIDNPLAAQVSTGAAQQTGATAQSQNGAAARSRLDGYSDRVQLSSLSAALRDLQTEDPARAAAVQQVGDSVRSGSYRIDPLQVGQKIIGEATELN